MTDRLLIGADIGGTLVKYVVADDDENRLLVGEIPTNVNAPATTVAGLAGAVREQLGVRWQSVASVGLACAGVVDPVAGRLGRAPNLLGWENTDLGSLIDEHFPGRTYMLANDVNAALVGEWCHGAGRDHDDMVMLALGTGVGGAVIVAGELLLGANYGAGEIGHMVVSADGPLCGCGNRGCLEAFAGARSLGIEARRRAALTGADPALVRLCRDDAVPTPRQLAAAADEGHEGPREMFRVAGRMLGIAVGNLINILDPDLVIVGGGVAKAGELILGPCREAAVGTVMSEVGKHTPIVAAELGTLAAAIGAVSLARSGSPPA